MSSPPPCSKKSYWTKALAKRARKIFNRLPKFKDKPLTNIYYCTQCSAYHLTSGNKQGSRNFTRRLNKRK